MRAAFALVAVALSAASSAVVVYSNGSYNDLSAVAPLNWDPNGIIQDFGVNAAVFNRIRIEVQDYTTPIGQISTLGVARIRLYNCTGRTIDTLTYSETPVFDRTYTTGSGTFQKSLSGFTRGGADVEYFDLLGVGAVGVGHFAIYVNFPTQTNLPQTYWLSSSPSVPGDPSRVFGPTINQAIGGADSEGAFAIYLDPVPEPTTLLALGAGVAVLARRRRRNSR